jgi:hypothetical protein
MIVFPYGPKTTRPADESQRVSPGRPGDVLERRRVNPTAEAGSPRRLTAGQRVGHLCPVTVGVKLVALDNLGTSSPA